MRLSDLRPNPGARHHSKRVGRGPGSGRMKTAGRGQKGQKARSGGTIPAYFEGGQNRFSQRMPYLGGFKNRNRKEYVEIHIGDLAVFEPGSAVNPQALAAKGLIRPRQAGELIKVLGDGQIDRALSLTVHKISESARTKVEGAGGSVTLIALPKPSKAKPRKRNAPTKA